MAWQYDHTHFKCSDPEKTVAFFKEHFDAKEVARFDSGGMSIVTLEIGAIVAGLFILSMLALIAGLLCFLREIYVAIHKERTPRGKRPPGAVS